MSARGHMALLMGTSASGGIDSFTKLMLHADATFVDSSSSAHTVTASGGAAVDTGTKKFGAGSIAVSEGTTSFFYVDGSSDFAFGTGDFTIDFWMNPQGVQDGDLVYDSIGNGGSSGAYPRIYISGSKVRFRADPSLADSITGTTSLSNGTWYHIAVARSGTSTKLFVGGTQEGSTYSDSNNYLIGTNRPIFAVNGTDETSNLIDMFIDEIRVSKGIARWTANFTPPTSAYS